MDEYYTNTVTPIVQASGGSCDAYESNYSTALSYERTRDMLGMTNQQQSSAITAGMAAGLQNCWQQRTTDCMKMDPKRWGELLWIARQMQVLGIDRAGGRRRGPLRPRPGPLVQPGERIHHRDLHKAANPGRQRTDDQRVGHLHLLDHRRVLHSPASPAAATRSPSPTRAAGSPSTTRCCAGGSTTRPA